MVARLSAPLCLLSFPHCLQGEMQRVVLAVLDPPRSETNPAPLPRATERFVIEVSRTAAATALFVRAWPLRHIELREILSVFLFFVCLFV